MSNITIRVGRKLRKKRVECITVAKGLAAHCPPDRDKHSKEINITHTKSGLAVVQYLPESLLPGVIVILAGTNWDMPAAIIYSDQKKFKLIKEVCTMADKAASEKQENRIAADLKGRVPFGSGSKWGHRRDTITPDFLVEAKITDSTVYRVSLRDMEFLTEQAYLQGKVPIYVVGVAGQPDVVLVPMSELDPERLESYNVRSMPQKIKKTIPIHKQTAELLNSGKTAVSIGTKLGEYIVFGYESFLELAKRGINEG
jgi:hypothetical protein